MHYVPRGLISALYLVLAASCSQEAVESPSSFKTDLADNTAVKTTFDAYKISEHHCHSSQSSYKRAIVTGFGLFGEPFNISGIVAMSMAKEDFWPQNYNADSRPVNANNFFRHREASLANGAQTIQRTLEIEGETFEVCFILLDVKWDQAAAIILHESRLFKPNLVIMGGLNGAEQHRVLFESSAINNARASAGYNSDGTLDSGNTPTAKKTAVLPDLPLDEIFPLTWDAPKLASANASLISDINSEFTPAVAWARADNNYICNNVSIAVAAALSGRSVSLAGSSIKIQGMNFGSKVGFLHYPLPASVSGTADNGEQIFAWGKVLANMIKIGIEN